MPENTSVALAPKTTAATIRELLLRIFLLLMV
jgi:hypothetical protein